MIFAGCCGDHLTHAYRNHMPYIFIEIETVRERPENEPGQMNQLFVNHQVVA